MAGKTAEEISKIKFDEVEEIQTIIQNGFVFNVKNFTLADYKDLK